MHLSSFGNPKTGVPLEFHENLPAPKRHPEPVEG